MQHDCNKKNGPCNREEAIETADRQDAVEWLKFGVMRARAAVEHYGVLEPPVVTLPLRIAELVLASAQAGMHKGQGRGRPRDTRSVALKKTSIVMWAWRRQRELMAIDLAQGKEANALVAERLAAENASAHAFERYGLSLRPSTIQRMMQSSPEHLAGTVSDVD